MPVILTPEDLEDCPVQYPDGVYPLVQTSWDGQKAVFSAAQLAAEIRKTPGFSTYSDVELRLRGWVVNALHDIYGSTFTVAVVRLAGHDRGNLFFRVSKIGNDRGNLFYSSNPGVDPEDGDGVIGAVATDDDGETTTFSSNDGRTVEVFSPSESARRDYGA